MYLISKLIMQFPRKLITGQPLTKPAKGLSSLEKDQRKLEQQAVVKAKLK